MRRGIKERDDQRIVELNCSTRQVLERICGGVNPGRTERCIIPSETVFDFIVIFSPRYLTAEIQL